MKLRITRTVTTRLIALFAVTALFGACASGGDDSDDGGVSEPPDTDESGAMQAYMNDDPGSSSDSEYSGTMTGQGDVEVSTDRDTWYTMGSPRSFELTLQANGETAELTASADLPADTYRFVRINWDGVEANLDAGSVVDGDTLSSDVSLRLGDASTAVMSQEVDDFELETGASARIVVDLNSETWVRTENVSARQIPKDEFENKAEISIVSEN